MLRNRIAVNIAFFINGFIYANWVSRLPRLKELYQADNKAIGLVMLALALGAVLAMPFTGFVIVRNGSRRITLVSLVFYCLVVPWIPYMPHWGYAMILFLITGAFTGMLDVAMNAQAVMVEKAYNRPIMTSFHAWFSIGMALGAWAGSLFATLDLVYHFLTVSVICLAATIWVGYNLIHDRPEPGSVPGGPLFRLPSHGLISVGIIAFCCMLGEGAMADWSVLYMEDVAFSGASMAPLALSAFAAAMTAGRLVGDRIRSMAGDSRVIVLGGILSMAGIALLVAFPSPYMVIAASFLVGLGLSTIVPITYSIAGNTKGLPSGVGISMVTTVGYSGFLFGPPLIGFVADWLSLRSAMLLVAVLFVIMTVLGITRKKDDAF